MSDLYQPAENLQGDYIEAALHALHANRPDVAHRYLVEAFGSRAYGELLHAARRAWSGGDLTKLAAVVDDALQAGESND